MRSPSRKRFLRKSCVSATYVHTKRTEFTTLPGRVRTVEGPPIFSMTMAVTQFLSYSATAYHEMGSNTCGTNVACVRWLTFTSVSKLFSPLSSWWGSVECCKRPLQSICQRAHLGGVWGEPDYLQGSCVMLK